MTLNAPMAVILAYSTEFGGFGPITQKWLINTTRCLANGIRDRMSLVLFNIRNYIGSRTRAFRWYQNSDLE